MLISDYPLLPIPSGVISLRDDRKKQSWTAAISGFRLAKYPVTQDLYFRITGKNPSLFLHPRRPVENVSWMEAAEFCNLLSESSGLQPCYTLNTEDHSCVFHEHANGYRMPVEAEWEYACKAGTGQIRYGDLEDIAWFRDNSGQMTQPVGRKMPNQWGLHDMLGNVWEWCSDYYDTDVYGSYRIFRGGGWADPERSIMATTRRRSHPAKFKIDDLGFRIARNG
ncbi:formylglycine-generating enzyme family protein [Dyadobacter flavalbus]|uniref:Formylglycine-generating enzyme family protein n=1 Tax=Dyadobacter flavalbus TaxID=2579942 RepID=A0A5M8QY31_9BACT|nr:SUMF1/EgtB/PvdO family nonheme iron enzyme [Dyadobacter flavalbus]KAA6439323.1 formylglycine-generating enzyme family protein [Dyadobacter flavalbus]